jgi:assimilatory nitrate reductase catalytic subunit
MALPAATWWARVAITEGWDYLVATGDGPLIWHDFAHRAYGDDARLTEIISANGSYHAAAFSDSDVDGCLSIGTETIAAQWNILKELIADRPPDADYGCSVVPSAHWVPLEPVVCACFGVGMISIRDAVRAGATNVADIGRALGAGTNCGSCLPELKRVMAHARLAKAD